MTDRLSVYNGALGHCGVRTLVSLEEKRESRRRLDAAWDNKAVEYCLERGFWRFATRTGRMVADPNFTAEFGYQYAFPKPDDYLRTAAVCSDEWFKQPLTDYADEATVWFASIDTIYVQYTSDGAPYGNNIAAWSPSFKELVELYLASKVVRVLTQSDSKAAEVDDKLKKALGVARSLDAMNQPAKFPPQGGWSAARHGSWGRNPGYRG